MLDNDVKHIVNYAYVLNIHKPISKFILIRYGALLNRSRMAAFCAKKALGAGFFAGSVARGVAVNPLFATLRYLTTGV